MPDEKIEIPSYREFDNEDRLVPVPFSDETRQRLNGYLPNQDNKRKPIQISTSTGEHTITFMILCDDGSMWILNKNKWARLPDVPQENEGNEK